MLETLKKEWVVVKAAPWSFFIVLCITVVLLWAFFRYVYGERNRWLKEQVAHLKSKLENANRATEPAHVKEPPASDWREGFRNPRFSLVSGRRYENESIPVDGKSFRRCSFKNVTFNFQGNAPFEFAEETQLDAGSVRFVTDNPAIILYNEMTRKFEAIAQGKAKIEQGMLDDKGHDMPLLLPTVKRLEPTATAPRVIVIKIEQAGDAMTPQTSLLLKNVGSEVAQKVTVKPFLLSGKAVSFTKLAVLAINAEQSISPMIEKVENPFSKRDLLDALFREWASNDLNQRELAVPSAIQFENLNGVAFEVPFDLVYCAYVHRLYKISQNERSKRELVLLEARNFSPIRPLSAG